MTTVEIHAKHPFSAYMTYEPPQRQVSHGMMDMHAELESLCLDPLRAVRAGLNLATNQGASMSGICCVTWLYMGEGLMMPPVSRVGDVMWAIGNSMMFEMPCISRECP